MTRSFGILILAGLCFVPPARAADCDAMLAITGAPESLGEAPDHTRLCRLGYVLDYDNERKDPIWVIEWLKPERFKGSADREKLGNPFAPDPDLQADKRAELSDYRGSGYDRGHMAPAASMKFSTEAMKESFYLSNMAPQVGIGLNRGIWAGLEKLTRTWTCDRSELVVITGPIFDEQPKSIGRDAVAVPSAFFKIVYEPGRKRAIAFILPNTKIDLGGHDAWEALKSYIVPIAQVEAETGLNFLSKLSARDQKRLETRKSIMWPDRGECH